jgi:hypothetical protein
MGVLRSCRLDINGEGKPNSRFKPAMSDSRFVEHPGSNRTNDIALTANDQLITTKQDLDLACR